MRSGRTQSPQKEIRQTLHILQIKHYHFYWINGAKKNKKKRMKID